MTPFEENNPAQLKLFLERLNRLVDEFHPNIYLLNDVFRGVQTIEIAILNELNKDIHDSNYLEGKYSIQFKLEKPKKYNSEITSEYIKGLQCIYNYYFFSHK